MKLYCFSENTCRAAEVYVPRDEIQAEWAEATYDVWLFGDDTEEELTRDAWFSMRCENHYRQRCGQNVLNYLDTWEECAECTCGVDRENEGGQCGGCGTIYCTEHKDALNEGDTCRECG